MGNDTGEVGRLMGALQVELRDHEKRIVELEKSDARQDEQIGNLKQMLDEIRSNTTWTFRLIVGALVTGVIGAVIALVFRVIAG
jgi:hypothetical protein